MIYFLTTDKVHNFERVELEQLLSFASYESFFIFDGEYYTQIDSVTMRSPLGPTLANAFFCVISRKSGFQNALQNFLQNVYKRYVDDIFVTFNSYSQLIKFVDYINHQQPNTELTFQV